MSTRTTIKRLGVDRAGVEIEFVGEHYPGDPLPLDTEVRVSEGTMCVITWADREAFTQELQAVIDKYRI